MGGFGLQGIIAVPFLNAVDRVFKDSPKIVSSGLAGAYAILWELYNDLEAYEFFFNLIKEIVEEIFIVDRGYICEGKKFKKLRKKAMKWCSYYALKDGVRSHDELWTLFGFLSDRQLKNVSIEVFDLEKKEVVLIENECAFEAMKASLSLPGIFPAYKGRFVSTTFLTQIVVESAKDGDLVLVNFRDTKRCTLKSANEILAHSAELRSIYYAKSILQKKNVIKVYTEPISWVEFTRFPHMVWELTGSLVEKLKKAVET